MPTVANTSSQGSRRSDSISSGSVSPSLSSSPSGMLQQFPVVAQAVPPPSVAMDQKHGVGHVRARSVNGDSPLLGSDKEFYDIPSAHGNGNTSPNANINARAASPSASTSANRPSPSPRSVPAWLIVGGWICLSTAVSAATRREIWCGITVFATTDALDASTLWAASREIMMGSKQFKYPITLTSIHLLYQTIATRLLHRYTNLIAGVRTPDYTAVSMDELETGSKSETSATYATTSAPDARQLQTAKDSAVFVPWGEYKRLIIPPAVMFSLSLVLSNWAYLYLTTAFIHMLKAVSPVAILLAAFAFGTKTFSVKLLLIVIVISFGVGIASYGETSFNMTGFMIQMTAIAIEATRVTLIQILLAGKDMSPLKSLYLFAPICLAINVSLILPVEGFTALAAIPKLGFWVIFSNASLTMALNLSAIYLIGISSMVLSLSKVVKDVIMVGGSALLLGDNLTSLQAVGYTIATVGMLYYKAQ
ncbi:BZ3500_MvSof-1268-A1-R1_Chr2-1g04322 [Microbotryum saponariae]|uniref:BZ3500_MvSof-1268-A1-R1_Chr2-1g04322 protein n=1 Tax=Microbotryum saponariae TaxID=289078 RepID=A0A2X0KEI9_9BASI|nr:BZ3500_MvSof-1268-A1-R1_Chr2-1g04322 [Microbotryum saponariae]SCZ91429.1 BZ3501_MvSof-1269-A2-R1_Chr2-1g03978 [Microbotryum saponariae]